MFRALDFFRKSATRNAEAPCSEVVEKNNLIHSPERLKSYPSYPSYPIPESSVLTVAEQRRTPGRTSSGPPEPRPRWVPGNSGNSGNFLVGSARKNRNFFEAGGTGH